MKRLTTTVVGLLALVLSRLPAAAQSVPSLPAGAQVYVAGTLVPSYPRLLDLWDRLDEIPATRHLLHLLEFHSGLDVRRDVLRWTDARFVAGVLGSPGRGGVGEWYAREQRERRYRGVVNDLQNLASGAELYRSDRARPPAQLEELVPEFVSELPSTPGVDWALEVKGDQFILRTTFAADSPLVSIGTPPYYSSEDGLHDEQLLAHAQPVGWVVALSARRQDLARLALQRWAGRCETMRATNVEGLEVAWSWRVGQDSGVVGLGRGWVIATDDPALCRECVNTLNSGGGVTLDPAFQDLRRHLMDRPQMLGYVDLQALAAQVEPFAWVKRVGAVSLGAASAMEPGPIRSELFLRLSEGSALDRLLVGGEQVDTSILNTVPWAVSNLVLADMRAIRQVVHLAGDIDPALGILISTGMVEIENRIGFSPGSESGPTTVLVQAERIDIYYYLITRFAYLEGLSLRQFPVTAVLEMRTAAERDALYHILSERLGEHPRSRFAYDTRVESSQDGEVTLAVKGNRILMSLGGSQRLLERLLETQVRSRRALTSLRSYRHFQEQRGGRELGLGHSKVDWLYSLMKGFLLMLGSDFRLEADELGRLRDAYWALEAEPEGLRLRWAVYQTGGQDEP